MIEDTKAFAGEAGAASWLDLCGEEFALARRHVAALDQLPRPTLVTCRVGPRSSALVYLYAGLKSGATAHDVLARARADGAPFSGSEELEAWVAQGVRELSDTQG